MNNNSSFREQHCQREILPNENDLFHQPQDTSFIKVGDYLLGKTIGKGTFGKVKLGVHLPTQEKVAIKILEKSMILTESDASSIRSEIEILSTLRHPNISQLLEVLESDTCIFLILEFASNGELFHYIASRGKLSEQEACIIFAQALNALEYMQTKNICHRDLKPENMLFNANFQLKIIDFGLGKISSEGTDQQLHTCCGSPCYASPETLSSQPYVGKYVDLWSLGIILHAMLCGYLPFDDDNQNGLFQKILKCEFTMPQCISPEAAVVISGLLKKEPTQRITISEIKQTEFYKSYITGEYKNIQNQGCNEIESTGIQLDQIVIQQMTATGYDIPQLVQDIVSKNRNQNTVTYYLLKNKLSQNNSIRIQDTRQQVLQQSPQQSTRLATKNLSQSLPPSKQPQSSMPFPLPEHITNQQHKNKSTSVSKISPVSPNQQLNYQHNSLQTSTAIPPKQRTIQLSSQVTSLLKTISKSVQNIKTKKKNVSDIITFKDTYQQQPVKQIAAPSISSGIPRSNIKQQYPFGFHQDPLSSISEHQQDPSRIPSSLVVSPMKNTNQLIQSPQLNILKTSTPLFSSQKQGQQHHRSSKSTMEATILQSPRFKTDNQKYSNQEDDISNNNNYQTIFSNFLKSSYQELKKKKSSSKLCSQTVQSVHPYHRQTKSQSLSTQIEQNILPKISDSQIIKRQNVNKIQQVQRKIPSKSITEMFKIPSNAPKQRQSQEIVSHNTINSQTSSNNNQQHKRTIDNKTNNNIYQQMPQSFSDSSSGGQTTASNLGNNSQEPLSPKSYQYSNSVSFTNYERFSLPSPGANLPFEITPIQKMRTHKSDYSNGNPTKGIQSNNNNKSNPRNLYSQTTIIQDNNSQTYRSNRSNHQMQGVFTSTKKEFIPEQCESPTNFKDIQVKTTHQKTRQLAKQLLSQHISNFLKPKPASFFHQGIIPEPYTSLKHSAASNTQQPTQSFATQQDSNQQVTQKLVKPSKDLLMFLKKLKDAGKLSTNTQENLNTSKQPQIEQFKKSKEKSQQQLSLDHHTMENYLSQKSKGATSMSLNISPQMIGLIHSSKSVKQSMIQRPRSQELKIKQNPIDNLHPFQNNIHKNKSQIIQQKLPKEKQQQYSSCSVTGRTTTQTNQPIYISNSIHASATTTTNSTITIPTNNYQHNQFITEKENCNSKPNLNNNYTVVIKPEIIPQKNDLHRTHKSTKQEKTLMALLDQLKTTSNKNAWTSHRDKNVDSTIADWSRLQKQQRAQQQISMHQSLKSEETTQNCFK